MVGLPSSEIGKRQYPNPNMGEQIVTPIKLSASDGNLPTSYRGMNHPLSYCNPTNVLSFLSDRLV